MESSPVKRQKGIKKFWTRFKTLLKSKTPPDTSTSTMSDSSARGPSNIPQHPVPNVSNPSPSGRDESQILNPASESLQPSTPSQPTQISSTVLSQSPGDTAHPSSQDDTIEVDDEISTDLDFSFPDHFRPRSSTNTDPAHQRAQIAQNIFSQYGIKFEAAELKLKAKSQIERVEKQPRLRVRWTCHQCRSTFGRDKTCPKCAHWRCRDCIRSPPKQPGAKVRRPPAKPTPISPPMYQSKTGTCHECKTHFDIPATRCENCHHQICERCLKESIEEALPATSIAAAS